MARHSKAELAYISRIKRLMTQAGIYEERFDIQIEQTAENMAFMDDVKHDVKNEGWTISEEKVHGGTKILANPLLFVLQNAQGILIKQLGALGLNKTQEKKSEAKEVKRKDADGVQQFFGQN